MNKKIGEKIVVLCDEHLPCIPDFTALVVLEEYCGDSIVQIFDRVSKSIIKVKDVSAIIFACHKSKVPTTKHTFHSIGELVVEHGLSDAVIQAVDLIKNVLGSKEKKTQAADPSKPSSE